MTVIGYATLRYSPDALSLLGVRVTLRCGKRRCVSTDPSVATVWFPAILAAVVCTAFWGTTPLCCLFAVVFVPVLISLISLAEVNDGDNQVHIKLLWPSNHVSKADVLEVGNSFLPEIGVWRPRTPILPWGRVYFVRS